jgi:hypothetical protein
MLENILVALVLAAIFAAAAAKIYLDKKQGVHCVGCPHAKTCAAKNSCPGIPAENPADDD